MNKMKIITAFVLIILIAVSCGQDRPAEILTVQPAGPDTLILTVTDTIGVLYGDSIMEFGNITDAEFSPEGQILILDGLKCRLSIFTREGELVRTVGRSGSGPGEFQYPRHFAQLTDGRLLFSDWSGAAMVFFDADLNYQSQILGFYPVPPMGIVPGTDGSFIGGNLSLNSGEGYEGISYIGNWTGDSMEPSVQYEVYPLDIQVSGSGDEMNVDVNNSEVGFDSDSDGNLFTALQCDSVYCIRGYRPDGEVFLTIEKNWERLERTQEELDDLIYSESLSRGDDGTSVNRSENLDPYLYHDAVATVRVDDSDNIWVLQGYTQTPTFEVYSREGELLHIVIIPELDGIRGLDYWFHNGLLAYDYAPADYPKVYLLALLSE